MLSRIFAILWLFIFSLTQSEASANTSDQQELVERAKLTFQSLFNDDSYKKNIESLLERAHGVIIIPSLVKAGFLLGGEGGSGVVLAKRKDGQWSYPSFVTFAGGSLGFQIGIESSEVLLIVMTEKGLRSIMNDSFTLGADVSIAAGPVGAGLSAQTTANLNADLYSFSRSKGLFGGGALKGSVVKSRDAWNEAYYGQDVQPDQILIQQSVKNPGADSLRSVLQGTNIYNQPSQPKVTGQPIKNSSTYNPLPQTKTTVPLQHESTDNQEQHMGNPKELLPWQRG